MSRLRADLMLLLAALIWGLAFIAQKSSFDHVGAYTFVAARFFISSIMVLPFAIREGRGTAKRKARPLFTLSSAGELILLCLVFSAAVILQQLGIASTSIAHAGFLTGLYAVFVPVICWVIYRQRPSLFILPAGALTVLGIWLLSGISIESFAEINPGDVLVLLCAIGFAWQIVVVGRIMRRNPAPFRLSFIQYASMTAIALVPAMIWEQPQLKDIFAALYPILYAGILAGGVAYTLQMVAQQYTPSSDSAIILSSEALFAALGGLLIAKEHISLSGWMGCGAIFAAILMVECGPSLVRRLRKSA